MKASNRRGTGVTRATAAAIARARIARTVISCCVSEVPPRDIVWETRPLPRNCWYVTAGAMHPGMLDGPPLDLFCISKRSGRVLFTALRWGLLEPGQSHAISAQESIPRMSSAE